MVTSQMYLFFYSGLEVNQFIVIHFSNPKTLYNEDYEGLTLRVHIREHVCTALK